jgi:trans-L-3-hydroxyproline dehydratase
MQTRKAISIIGCHAEGEVGDVIIGGVLPPAGATAFERMKNFERDHDAIRRLLISEPRGSVARHVNLITPSTRPDCVAGAIIMEPTEYPPMSGSNTICIATVLLETGMVPMREPVTHFRLDMPAGPVDIEAKCAGGKCVSVTLRNVPSFALKLDAPLQLPDGRMLRIDIAYGGMIFAMLDVTELGFSIVPHEARELVMLGEALRVAARAQYPDIAHPQNPAIRGVSIVQLHAPFKGPGTAARNACIVAPGRADRSPTGTGLSARLAVLHARGLLAEGDCFDHESIIGSRFKGRIEQVTSLEGRPAVIPAITGRAWITGSSQIFVDPSDPWPEGYRVSDTWPGSADMTQ